MKQNRYEKPLMEVIRINQEILAQGSFMDKECDTFDETGQTDPFTGRTQSIDVPNGDLESLFNNF